MSVVILQACTDLRLEIVNAGEVREERQDVLYLEQLTLREKLDGSANEKDVRVCACST